MSSVYIALIADATASRALPPPRRARLQHALRRALAEQPRRWRTALAARFALTLGDEVQALLTTADPVWAITHEMRFRFPDVEWVVACGRGAIATRLERGTTAPEVDGPCFHAARTALEQAKRRRLLLPFGGFGPPVQPLAGSSSGPYSDRPPTAPRAAPL